MANLAVKNAVGTTEYLKSSGAGTDLDPKIVQHLDTNSAAILTALTTLAGAIASGHVVIADGGGSITVDGVFWQATQPVSGTVTASNVTGNVAAGATDSGNPVKAGGVYNSSLPTLTTGQRGDLQLDANGKLLIAATNNDPATGTNQTSGNTKLDTLHTDMASVDGHVDGLEASATSIDSKTPALGQAVAGASVPVVLPAAQITTLTPPAAITGFATGAKQDTGNTSLASIDTKIPASPATAGNQTTANASLSSIDGKVPVLGQAVVGASVPVVLPAAQITTLTPPAAITGFATAAKQPTLGTAGVASTDVITVQGIVSGVAQPVSGTLTGITNVVHVDDNSGTLSVDDGAGSLTVDSPGLPTALGQAVSGASMPVVLPAAQITTLTPPAAITGFATETTLAAQSAKLPATLGQKAMTASMAVVVASDQSAVPVTTTIALPTVIYNGNTNVTTAGTRVVLAASQAILSGVTIKAKSANTGTIYVGSSTVSSSNGYALSPGDSVFLEIANLNTVNIDSSVNGEGVTFAAT